MLRYKDLPEPPCNDIVTAIEEVKKWLEDPVNNKEPDSEKVSLVYNIDGKAKEIRESLEKAYTERITDREKGTADSYFRRLKQINDTANLIMSVYANNLSREALLKVDVE